MYVGSLRLRIRLHGCRSLKEKRRPRQMLRDRIRNHFKVAVAEVADQDSWDMLSLGVAAVGPDRTPLDQLLKSVADAIEDAGVGELIEEELVVQKR